MTTQYARLDLPHTHMLEVMAEARRIEDELHVGGSITFGRPSSYINWVAGAWRLYHGASMEIAMPKVGKSEIWAVMNGDGCMTRLPGVQLAENPLAPYKVRDFQSAEVHGKTYDDLAKLEPDAERLADTLTYAHRLAALGVLTRVSRPAQTEDLLLQPSLEIPIFLLACIARYIEDAYESLQSDDNADHPSVPYGAIEASFSNGPWPGLELVQPTAQDYATAGQFVASLCENLKEGPEALLRFGPDGKDGDWNHLIHVAFNHLSRQHERANA